MANNTGHYRWDPVARKFIKVSDTPGSVSLPYFPKRSQRECGTVHEEHLSATGERFSSRRSKKEYMRANHIAEVG